MKKILVSFATDRFKKSLEHLRETAKPHFNGIAEYSDANIKPFIQENIAIFKYQRGFGYWLWKPYIILETLKQLSDGDILFYVDAGNSIVNDLSPVFDVVDNDSKGLLLFENRDGNHEGKVWTNKMWTKYDCFHRMNCLEDKYINGFQIDGSYAVVKKNEFTLNFYEEYLKYAKDPQIITDLPNIHGNNFPEFRDHRHDQCIASLLSIKHNITIFNCPSEWGTRVKSDKPTFKQLFFHHHGYIFH